MKISEVRIPPPGGAPLLLWGPPGCGKSAAIMAAARREGLPTEVVLASIREPADFAGLPVLQPDGWVRLAPPSWASRLAQAGRGVLFLDEISCAPPAVQAAVLRVVLDRVVGDCQLPPDVVIVAAGNPPSQAAGGWDLSPPLANRFVHLHVEVDPVSWAEEFPGYWGSAPRLPGIDASRWARARALVAGFLRNRPALLSAVPADPDQAGRAWPSPRSWDHASRALAWMGGDPMAAAPWIAGAVGDGPAMEFMCWVEEADLPDPEAIITAPRGWMVPTRGDQVFAALAGVAEAVVSRPTQERWAAAISAADHAAEALGARDVAVPALRRLMGVRRPEWPAPKELAAWGKLLAAVGGGGR